MSTIIMLSLVRRSLCLESCVTQIEHSFHVSVIHTLQGISTSIQLLTGRQTDHHTPIKNRAMLQTAQGAQE